MHFSWVFKIDRRVRSTYLITQIVKPSPQVCNLFGKALVVRGVKGSVCNDATLYDLWWMPFLQLDEGPVNPNPEDSDYFRPSSQCAPSLSACVPLSVFTQSLWYVTSDLSVPRGTITGCCAQSSKHCQQGRCGVGSPRVAPALHFHPEAMKLSHETLTDENNEGRWQRFLSGHVFFIIVLRLETEDWHFLWPEVFLRCCLWLLRYYSCALYLFWR